MKNFTLVLALLISQFSIAQNLDPVPLDDAWKAKMKKVAPEKPAVSAAEERKVLVFDLHTGYEHWVIPHTTELIKILGEKSGAYSVEVSKDISIFEKYNLAKYDAVVLNNTCSDRARRHLFWDALGNRGLSDVDRNEEAQRLEQNLLQYVYQGGGLTLLHGALTVLNFSDEFSAATGGSFDYHPPQQEVIADVVDKNHPITAPFKGKPFVCIDEPYFLNRAYSNYNFKPLLSMNTDLIEDKREEVEDKTKYIAWIKSYGSGRVFYSAPSHNAQSFEDPRLLQFFLNGMQYVSGDLKCDDSPIK